MNQSKAIQVGGQAVIEGVMMRSKDHFSVAVRRQDGSIYVRLKPFISVAKKYRLLGIPILRGAVVLVESLILGIQSLTFSGDVAMVDEKKGKSDGINSEPTKKGFWANL
ncbi:DUF1385 domain-containing protein, partial [bacterium]|nr:DUF1385 domain-containing protein [bacterium]